MRILFSHMSLYFSHIASDAHLISYMISVSQMNSHVLEYDLRSSDDFLILPVFSDELSYIFWVYQCDFLIQLSGVQLAKVLHFLNQRSKHISFNTFISVRLYVHKIGKNR